MLSPNLLSRPDCGREHTRPVFSVTVAVSPRVYCDKLPVFKFVLSWVAWLRVELPKRYRPTTDYAASLKISLP